MSISYNIARLNNGVSVPEDWTDPVWAKATPIELKHFHANSSEHRPRVEARALHAKGWVHVLFTVHDDRHLLARCRNYMDSVCRDSCVEFFVEPLPNKGYFNFEVNCAGVLLLSYVEDCSRLDNGEFTKWRPVDMEHARHVRIRTSMNAPIDEELPGPITWHAQLSIPLKVMEAYLETPLGDLDGKTWRANFYKCADATSGRHWASWSDIGQRLNFHKPERFGTLAFGR